MVGHTEINQTTEFTKLDFGKLSDEDRNELLLFEEFIRDNTISHEELEQFLDNNPNQKYYVLSVRSSPLLKRIEVRKNIVHWKTGHKEKIHLAGCTEGVSLIEDYIDWLVSQKKEVVFIVPKNFFTHFSNSELRYKAKMTLREFERLIEKISEWDPEKVTFVYDPDVTYDKENDFYNNPNTTAITSNEAN